MMCDFLVYSPSPPTNVSADDVLCHFTGRDHVNLTQVEDSAYKSMSAESFPNFALLNAPRTSNLEDLSPVFEAQARYTAHLAREVYTARSRRETLILTPDREILRFHHEQVLARQLGSEKRDAGGSWPWTNAEYVELLSKVRWNDYDVEGTASTRVSRKGVEDVGRTTMSIKVFERRRFELLVMALLVLLGIWAAARMFAS